MANLNQKALRNLVTNEYAAANALAVLMNRVKDKNLRQTLGELRLTHEANIESAGLRLLSAGGQYPNARTSRALPKEWERVATSSKISDALLTVLDGEQRNLSDYGKLLQVARDKKGDEELSSFLNRQIETNSALLPKLNTALQKAEHYKPNNLPRTIAWIGLIAGCLAAGAVLFMRLRNQNVAEKVEEKIESATATVEETIDSTVESTINS